MKIINTKYIVLFILLINSHVLFSQIFSYTFTIKTWGGLNPILKLDSLVLYDENDRFKKTTYFPEGRNGNFKIDSVLLGQYNVHFFALGESFPEILITTCTYCKNEETLMAYPKKRENMIFDKIWIGASYKSGFNQFCDDFKKNLSDKENIKLKESGKLIVKCFITASGKISDLLFEPATISEETKSLVRKGLSSILWRPEVANGKITDGLVVIPIYKMFEN